MHNVFSFIIGHTVKLTLSSSVDTVECSRPCYVRGAHHASFFPGAACEFRNNCFFDLAVQQRFSGIHLNQSDRAEKVQTN